jgi:hypothetical protein
VISNTFSLRNARPSQSSKSRFRHHYPTFFAVFRRQPVVAPHFRSLTRRHAAGVSSVFCSEDFYATASKVTLWPRGPYICALSSFIWNSRAPAKPSFTAETNSPVSGCPPDFLEASCGSACDAGPSVQCEVAAATLTTIADRITRTVRSETMDLPRRERRVNTHSKPHQWKRRFCSIYERALMKTRVNAIPARNVSVQARGWRY